MTDQSYFVRKKTFFPIYCNEMNHSLDIKREINYMSQPYLRRYVLEVLVPMVNAMGYINGPGLPLINQLVDFEYLQQAAKSLKKDDLIRSTIQVGIRNIFFRSYSAFVCFQLFSDSFYGAPATALANLLASNGLKVQFFVNNFVSSDIYQTPSNLTGIL